MESMNKTITYYVNKLQEYYKNEKYPQLQAMWASDTSRINYTIKSKFDNKSSGWHADKCGNIIIERILNPLLIFTKDLILTKCQNNLKYMEYISKKVEYPVYKVDNLLTGYEIKVRNNLIQPEIMKNLSPHMYLDIDKQMKLLDVE